MSVTKSLTKFLSTKLHGLIHNSLKFKTNGTNKENKRPDDPTTHEQRSDRYRQLSSPDKQHPLKPHTRVALEMGPSPAVKIKKNQNFHMGWVCNGTKHKNDGKRRR